MVAEVYLDNILLQNEPDGLRDITEIIEKDYSLKGYVVKYNQITLKFWGDGGVYVRNAVRADGYEKRIDIIIRLIDAAGYSDTITAYFFTTDVEYNATKNTYEVQLEDDNFGAFIKSGSKQKISVGAALTRNGETLTTITADSVTIFTPSTGINIVTNARIFDLLDVMELLVSYLSDNSIAFESEEFFAYRYGLTKHYYINTAGLGTVPDNSISFYELMDFYNKCFNAWFWIDLSEETPVMRLDTEADLMSDFIDISFTDVDELKVTFDQDLFYSAVRVGSSRAIIDRGALVYQLPYTPLIGFSEEVVNSRSETTLDNELDLTIPNFVCDTNKIEKYIIAPVTDAEYDEEHVIIQYADLIDQATKGQYGISGSNRLYNESLINKNILNNHYLPSELVSEIGTDTDGFLAYITSNTAVAGTSTPMIFDDDNVLGSDPGANYDNTSGEYTIPADGTYRFRADMWLETTSLMQTYGGLLNGVRINVTFARNGVTQQTQTTDTFGITQSPLNTIKEYEGFYEAGDKISVNVQTLFLNSSGTGTNTASLLGTFTYTDNDGAQRIGGCSFSTVFVYNSGGAVVTPDTLDYPAVNYDFIKDINLSDWKKLKQNPIQGIKVDTNGKNTSTAWIKRISRNWITGKSDVTLFTKLSENNIY